MTTVVICNDCVAWDSRITTSNEHSVTAFDKVEIVDDKIVCFAGDASMREPMLRWVKKGCPSREHPRGRSYEVIVIHGDPKKPIYDWFTQAQRFATPISTPVMLGTGATLARGAVQVLKNTNLVEPENFAMLALRAAADVDVYTGEPFKQLCISATLARLNREKAKAERIAKAKKAKRGKR